MLKQATALAVIFALAACGGSSSKSGETETHKTDVITSYSIHYTKLYDEFRLAFDNGGPLRAQAGLFSFDEQVSIISKNFNSLALGNPETSRATRSLDTDSLGIFASLSYDLTERP